MRKRIKRKRNQDFPAHTPAHNTPQPQNERRIYQAIGASVARGDEWSQCSWRSVPTAYLYVLDDLGVQGVVVGVWGDFCGAVLEQVLLPVGGEGKRRTGWDQHWQRWTWTCNIPFRINRKLNGSSGPPFVHFVGCLHTRPNTIISLPLVFMFKPFVNTGDGSICWTYI